MSVYPVMAPVIPGSWASKTETVTEGCGVGPSMQKSSDTKTIPLKYKAALRNARPYPVILSIAGVVFDP